MSMLLKQASDICPTCQRKLIKNGRDKQGRQTWRCVWCARPHGEARHIHFVAQNTMTARRIQVLKLAGEGMNHKEIAERIFVTPSTVKNTLCDIHKILESRNTAHAVFIACKRGLI